MKISMMILASLLITMTLAQSESEDNCESGIVSNGVCYFLGDKKEVFADAAVTCENNGAQLANLLDDAVYGEVIGYLREQAPKSCGGKGSNWFWTGVEYDFNVKSVVDYYTKEPLFQGTNWYPGFPYSQNIMWTNVGVYVRPNAEMKSQGHLNYTPTLKMLPLCQKPAV